MKLSSVYRHCLIVLPFFQAILDVWTGIRNDALIILADPALDWKIEILFAYPGFWALFWFRISHLLFVWRFPLLPRIIMGVVRLLTAVDIHPGAKISGGVFIDHGAGVVIGATAEIGAGTIVYHQVTLGASGKPVPKGERRHPAVGKGCVLGAGTKLIGAINIGDGVITGANSVVTKSVEPFCTAVGVPARSRPQAPLTTATRLVPEPENTTKELQMPTARPESPNTTRSTHKRLPCPREVQGLAHVCSKKCNSEISLSTENHIQANLDVPLQ